MTTAARLAVWTLIVGKLVGAWGLTWDIQWHLRIGRDSFWIAPHVMMYAGVTAGFIVTFGSTAMGTAIMAIGQRQAVDDRPRGPPLPVTPPMSPAPVQANRQR